MQQHRNWCGLDDTSCFVPARQKGHTIPATGARLDVQRGRHHGLHRCHGTSQLADDISTVHELHHVDSALRHHIRVAS